MGLVTFFSPNPVFANYRFLITQVVIIQVVIGTARVTSGVKAVLAHVFLLLTLFGCFHRRNVDGPEVGSSGCRLRNKLLSVPKVCFCYISGFCWMVKPYSQVFGRFCAAFHYRKSVQFL